MALVVLAKVVPDADDLGVDASGRTVRRDGVEMFLNPFDQRALRVALDGRSGGETVTVLSMGPPSSETALSGALALGADRAVLVVDPALKGSDTLVTARVLARALQRIDHRLVLAGARSTDAETGQVPAEVAALLGVPHVAHARAIRRDGDALEVTADRDDGWARYRLSAPAVLSVGEKIARIVKVDEAAARGRRSDVECWDLDRLGLSAGHVGERGSPTIVESVARVAPSRAGLRVDEGPVEDRVRRAVTLVRDRWVPRPGPATPAAWAGGLPTENEAIVLATDEDGGIDSTGRSILTEVRRALHPLWPSALGVGPAPSRDDRVALAEAGALRLRWLETPAPVAAETAAGAMEGALREAPRAAAGFAAATAFGRGALAPVAARLGLGLTGDATAGRVGSDGILRLDKPSFGGGDLATIVSRTRPALATVRPGAFEVGAVPDPVLLEPDAVPPVPGPPRVVRVDRGSERDPAFGDLDRARVVVAVGRGIGGPDQIATLTPVLRTLGAALGATRKVVDAGWVPPSRQIGLTGRSIAPELAILVGVGGSPNHLIGWRRAGTLVAIDPRPDAPVLAGVDVGLVARWEEALHPLAAGLSAGPRERTG